MDNERQDVVDFPPLLERASLSKAVQEHRQQADEALASLEPEVVHLIETMRARATEALSDKDLAPKTRAAFVAAAKPFLLACRQIGSELLGDRWNDEDGMYFMANLVLQQVTMSACTHCILGTHEPTLHAVDDDRGGESE